MKRNIISSKVEPQNTEDLWLNLVDGNIYSYEYGTWTNVNNVPNRVFNLDIDYTEENLTKFLSPLYEEGFSDDDFPKKVWDKFCETNPEFKLQGERENVRINVSINKAEKLIENLTEYAGDINTPIDFEGEMVPEKDTQYINWAGSSSHIDVLYVNDLGLSLSRDTNLGNYNSYPCIIRDTVNDKVIFTTDVPNISSENNKFPVSLLKELGIIGSRHSFTYMRKSGSYGMDISREECSFYIKLKDAESRQIASADIKLKQLSNDSSFIFTQEFPIYNSKYSAEYISGIVSNKLDKNKMWEYLCTDIKCLVPAKIDIVLPYNISSEEFPFRPEFVEDSLINKSDIFMASVASRYVEPENITDEELGNSYRHYLNLESPLSFGVYQKDSYGNTPIQDITSAPDHPVKLNFEYENIAFTPEMIKEDFYQRYYDNNTETYYNVKLLYNNNNTNDRYYFSLDIYDLNIRIIRYEVRDLTTYNSILFSGSNDEEVLEYLKNNYGYNENVIYNKVSISHSYKDGARGLRTILYPIPGNLKSEETTHVKLATYADNYSKHIRLGIGLSELPMENTKEAYTIGTNTTNTVGEKLRLDLYKIDIVNNNPISNTTIPLGDSIFYNGTLYIPLTIFKKALNGIGIDFSKYYYTFPAQFADSTTLHVTITSKDLKVNKLIEEDFVYLHVVRPTDVELSYNAFVDFRTHTHHIKTQAYYDLLKKFGYEITK